jgi:hypothetical protein
MATQDNLGPQWYHGTNQAHDVGDLIDPAAPHERVHGISHNDRVCFTSDIRRAQFYAGLATEKFGGEAKVYNVEPTGEYHQDLQTMRVPENKTTKSPLRVLGEA